jgi:hypothetical protein
MALEASLPKLSSPLWEQVIDLLSFLRNDRGAVYSEADDLLSRGLIHRDQCVQEILKLFKLLNKLLKYN